MFSKIVAVADGFDAATSRRVYQTDAVHAGRRCMREMRDNPRRGMDPVVVKAFINLIGIYPVGTLVVLDTFELAIVHAVNPTPGHAVAAASCASSATRRATCCIPATLVDLADATPDGVFVRTIIKTENPERYGIRVGDYFV